jgi:hypothetical protein
MLTKVAVVNLKRKKKETRTHTIISQISFYTVSILKIRDLKAPSFYLTELDLTIIKMNAKIEIMKSITQK